MSPAGLDGVVQPTAATNDYAMRAEPDHGLGTDTWDRMTGTIRSSWVRS